jgi:tripartite-type tricarboxylate transporter receptor subunit TctC
MSARFMSARFVGALVARWTVALWILALVICFGAPPRQAAAESVDDMFRGKRINIMVAYETGGGYDLYARLIAQFLSRHLPGEPTVIVQNMPGAGGLKAARYLLDVAPTDGTALGVLSQTIPFDTVLGYSEDVDAGKLQWIGRMAMNVEVGVAFAKSGIRSFDDVRAREVSVGGTGGTASSTVVPFLLSKLAGAKFKLVSGYRSANEVLLAMERGEVDMVGATGISTMVARWGPMLKDGSMRFIYQSALTRHPDAPGVPTLGQLGGTDEDREILDLFASGSAIGRTLVAPPGIAAVRVAVLRQAVAAALADPALVAMAKEHNIALEPGSAAEVEQIVRKTLATPKATAAKAKDVLNAMKTGR